MNATKIIVVLALAVFLITACSSSKAATKVPAETTVKSPSLDLKVEVSGRTATVNFKTDLIISPQHYGKERVAGEGHMHLYLDEDGEKKVSTEDNYVFKDLSVGIHKVKVSLHNNDHTPYNVTQTKDFEIK